MTNSPATPKSPPRLSAAVAHGLREGAAISLGVVALVLLVALLSFDPRDAGFSTTGAGEAIHNRVGSAGAYFANLLYFLCGRPAYLLPLALGVMAVRLGRAQAATEASSRANFAVRGLGFAVLVMSSCALAALHWRPGLLPQGAGGVIGMAVGSGLSNGLNLLGATLVLLAAWAASVAVAFGISWLRVIDGLGAAVWRGIRFLKERRHVQREVTDGRERKQARMEAGEAETRKIRARPPPRIEAPAPAVPKGERAEKERQVPLFDPPQAGELPALGLLDDPGGREASYSAEALEAMSRLVELKLKDFGVDVEVVAVHPGPVITRFELQPAPGVKGSADHRVSIKISRVALSVISVRVVDVIPGKSVIGLEIPNVNREIVYAVAKSCKFGTPTMR